jgi:hypothetical protein
MRVMRRAARYAYAFVAGNWDQVAALAYLARREPWSPRRPPEVRAGVRNGKGAHES